MARKFHKIGLIAKPGAQEALESLQVLLKYLSLHGYDISIEEATATLLTSNKFTIVPKDRFAETCDLVIVVGGDGSMLQAARFVIQHQIPVLGINRGRLGFLTDIHPNEIELYLPQVLAGDYLEEQRFLLTATILHQNQVIYENFALNDIVLLPGDYNHMIEFEISINQQLVCSQRADGQIIATPTGSTAYALSGGGPILHPNLDAIVLVPMFSHTLSSRPIVINGDSHIEIYILPDNKITPRVSCDASMRFPISPGDTLVVRKKRERLILLHPLNYNYYETLRSKLHWQKKL